jgi:hypothetical protein
LGRIAHEPLAHFFIVGAALFFGAQWHRDSADPHRVVITTARVAELADVYKLQFGRTPDAATLRTLVNQYTDDEILFREGIVRKVDRDDEIVRRRVIQKMRFIEQNVYAPAEPSIDELTKFFREHSDRYMKPAQVSFTHIYFSPDSDGSTGALQRAQQMLEVIDKNTSCAPTRAGTF